MAEWPHGADSAGEEGQGLREGWGCPGRGPSVGRRDLGHRLVKGPGLCPPSHRLAGHPPSVAGGPTPSPGSGREPLPGLLLSHWEWFIPSKAPVTRECLTMPNALQITFTVTERELLLVALKQHSLCSASAWGFLAFTLSRCLPVHTRRVTFILRRRPLQPAESRNRTLSLARLCSQPAASLNLQRRLSLRFFSLSADKPQMLGCPGSSLWLSAAESEGTGVLCPKKPLLAAAWRPARTLGGLLSRAAGLLAGCMLGRVKKAKASFRVSCLPPEYPETFRKPDQPDVGGLWDTLQTGLLNSSEERHPGPPSSREMTVWQPMSAVALIVSSCICFSLS